MATCLITGANRGIGLELARQCAASGMQVLATCRDPRIREVYHDSGRYHSTPDGEDLPEWFALRVACKRDVLESAMKDAGEAILRELGPDVAKRVSIRHYS